MSNVDKVKGTPERRSSPRLSAIKAAALKQQQHRESSKRFQFFPFIEFHFENSFEAYKFFHNQSKLL